MILRDTGIAYPTPVYEGEEPGPTVAGFGLSKNGYVMSLTGTVLSAGAGIGIENNIVSLTSTIPTVPTNVGAFTNDVGYLTAVPSDTATTGWVEEKGYLTGITVNC